MRAVPFVFLLFPVYGLDRVGEVITYNKKELLSFSFFRNSGLVCRRKILDRRLTSRTRQSKLPFGTSVKLWSLCPLVDWSLVLSGSLGEAQMEERAYRKLIAWLSFAGCWRPNTKYTGGWLPDGVQVSTHSSPPTHLPKEGETSLMLLIICNQRKERKEKKEAYPSPQSHKEEPKLNFLNLEKKILCRSPLIWVMPGEQFSAWVCLPIPLIPFVMMVQEHYWNAKHRV